MALEPPRLDSGNGELGRLTASTDHTTDRGCLPRKTSDQCPNRTDFVQDSSVKVGNTRADTTTMRHRTNGSISAKPPALTRRALIDLALVTAFVWIAVVVTHRLDLPDGLTQWNVDHPQWAIDEFALVSLFVAGALGVFSWRRWQESLRTIARHEATLERLRTTESAIASKDDLIRTVSHELRTPLTAMLGYAELLEAGEIPSTERADMVKTIIREGHDLSNIVEDLLTRARVEADTLEVALVRVNLAGQVAQVLEGWTPDERSRIEDRSDPSVVATANPARVRQIVRNLISNALKYGSEEITITMASFGDQIKLRVANLGAEIPEADRDMIFDPYYRLPGIGDTPGGLGLGLAISRQLARLMNGDLTYSYRADHSIFDLTLPRRVE